MARRVQVVFDCADPDRLARFWAEALGYRFPDPPAGFDTWAAWAEAQGLEPNRASAVEDPDGVGPRLFFQRVPEGKLAKNRMHLDVQASGGWSTPLEERRAAVDAEVARLKAFGATDERGPMEEMGGYWVRMNDPEGNEFCVV